MSSLLLFGIPFSEDRDLQRIESKMNSFVNRLSVSGFIEKTLNICQSRKISTMHFLCMCVCVT